MTLSLDQRWLLLHIGGWEIVGALASPEGVTRLMQSCYSSTGGRGRADDLPHAPQWVRGCGWETSGGVIKARGQGGPHVTVKAAEINRYAKQLPADIKAEIIACRDAGTANAVLRGRFCLLKRTRPDHDHATYMPWEEDRICPPTVEQENNAKADYWRIHAWQHLVLGKALGLDGRSHIAGDQLDLFGVGV